nr:hypothetical protein [Chloroflexota bacterium]
MLALIAVMAAASILVGGAVLMVLAADRASIDATAQRVAVVHQLANQLTGAGSAQELALADYVLSRQLPPRQRFDEAVLTYSQIADALRAATIDLPEGRAASDARVAARQTWRERVAGPVIIAVGRGDAPAITRFAEGAASDRVPMTT